MWSILRYLAVVFRRNVERPRMCTGDVDWVAPFSDALRLDFLASLIFFASRPFLVSVRFELRTLSHGGVQPLPSVQWHLCAHPLFQRLHSQGERVLHDCISFLVGRKFCCFDCACHLLHSAVHQSSGTFQYFTPGNGLFRHRIALVRLKER